MTPEALDLLGAEDCQTILLRCCSSRRWADGVTSRRPLGQVEAYCEASDDVWWKLTKEDWLEAFAGHPKIGDIDSLRKKYEASRTWSEGEQRGVDGASEETLQRLKRGNQAYEDRFGFIFIVCATGKSAAEMLALLEARLDNPPDEELRIAAAEQAKITRIRLEKLFEES